MLCERAEKAHVGGRIPPDSATADRTTELASGLPMACGSTLADGIIWLTASRAPVRRIHSYEYEWRTNRGYAETPRFHRRRLGDCLVRSAGWVSGFRQQTVSRLHRASFGTVDGMGVEVGCPSGRYPTARNLVAGRQEVRRGWHDGKTPSPSRRSLSLVPDRRGASP